MLQNIQKDILEINKKSSIEPEELILEDMQHYQNQVLSLASKIIASNKKIILVSGGSSAGKTTTSRILQEEMAKLGVSSFVISMDDFYFNMDTIPLRADGKHDIESPEALDIKTIKKCLGDLISKGETKLPQFDFISHKRKEENLPCKLSSGQVVFMEGLHALNPKMIEGLDASKIMRVYIHCGGSYTYKGEEIISSRDIRLMRRMLRDVRERDFSYEETLFMWDEVCKGEDKYILPYQKDAEEYINTFHPFEVLLYKSLLSKNLDKIKNAKELLSKLSFVGVIDSKLVPSCSVVREFIGGYNSED